MSVQSLTRFLLGGFAVLALSACDGVPVSDGALEKVEAARERNDGPPLWVLKDEDSTLYLYGTVHLLPDDLDWQRQDMRDVFAQAGTVFFEADTDGAEGAKAQALATSLGLRRDGLRLTASLDGYQSKLLEAVSNNSGLPLAALDSMHPWLATELITVTAAEAAGLTPDFSADEALKSRARRSGKNVIFLESAEDQIRQVSDLPKTVQIEVLTDLMENYDAMGADLRQIAALWAAGRAPELEEQLSAGLAKAPDEFREAVYTQRNEAWAEQLSAFMDESGTGFAAVGIGHLLGEATLVDALEARGHDVRRYFAFLGEDVIKPTDVSLPDVPGADE